MIMITIAIQLYIVIQLYSYYIQLQLYSQLDNPKLLCSVKRQQFLMCTAVAITFGQLLGKGSICMKGQLAIKFCCPIQSFTFIAITSRASSSGSSHNASVSMQPCLHDQTALKVFLQGGPNKKTGKKRSCQARLVTARQWKSRDYKWRGNIPYPSIPPVLVTTLWCFI